VGEGIRTARAGLDQPELVEEHGAAVGGRRLLEGAAQVGHGAVGRAPADGGTSGAPEQVHHPVLAARRRHQELRRDVVGRGAHVEQHPRRTCVLELALARRQLAVDGVADERVHEVERGLGAEDVGAREGGDLLGRLGLVELRVHGHGPQLRALAEHRHRARDRPRGARQAREAQQHRARDRARADLADHVDVAGIGLDPLGLERADELAEQQRVAAGRLHAGGLEALVRLRPEPREHQLADAAAAERPRLHRHDVRAADDLGEQRRVRAGLAAAQPGGHKQGQALEPRCQVGEEAQRGTVAPVQVVHRQQQRRVRGQVHGEPVEAVQRREGRVAQLVGLAARGRRLEDHPSRRGRSAQPGVPALVAGGAQRLEELAHHAVGEAQLELGPARRDHAEALGGGVLAQARQEAALADAGAALHHGEPGLLPGRRVEQGVQRRELALALQQQLAHAAASAPPSSRRERIPSLR
jgi:hypothetical protein